VVGVVALKLVPRFVVLTISAETPYVSKTWRNIGNAHNCLL
jgi:hypothetical protein